MKTKMARLLSIIAIICPALSILIMVQIEKEFEEALSFGLLVGCILGSLAGLFALLLNQNRSKVIMVCSILPMCPLVLYIALAIPFILYR